MTIRWAAAYSCEQNCMGSWELLRLYDAEERVSVGAVIPQLVCCFLKLLCGNSLTWTKTEVKQWLDRVTSWNLLSAMKEPVESPTTHDRCIDLLICPSISHTTYPLKGCRGGELDLRSLVLFRADSGQEAESHVNMQTLHRNVCEKLMLWPAAPPSCPSSHPTY